jgi:hypothetical protein
MPVNGTLGLDYRMCGSMVSAGTACHVVVVVAYSG